MRVLVTGANGFVGSALVPLLLQRGYQVVAATRSEAPGLPSSAERIRVGSLDGSTDWSEALGRGCEAVVHLAARVHVMDDRAVDPLGEFRRVNVDGTLRLARDAARSGVKRFVFVSSVKVNGESAPAGRPFSEESVPLPEDPYGISKLEAERRLLELGRQSGLEVVVIRPPLVYGPGVRANFAAMMSALLRGVPLPLASVDNQRSLVALDNLADFLACCITHPCAPGEVFFVSDGEDLSTPELLRRTASALGRRARLFGVPPGMLLSVGKMFGRHAMVERLTASLQVDTAKARRLLGWLPSVTVDDALKKTAECFLSSR